MTGRISEPDATGRVAPEDLIAVEPAAVGPAAVGPAGAEYGPESLVRRTLARHGVRFTSFSAIGAVVLILGIGVQALLVRAHAGPYGSYAGQAAFSIEL